MGPPGPQGSPAPPPSIATDAGLVGNGISTSPLGVDFGGNGASIRVARADHTHPRAMISCQTTAASIAPAATAWTDITTLVPFSDRFVSGISRSNSTFTFAQGGTYQLTFHLNTSGSGMYIGYRLRRMNGTQSTLLQHVNYSQTGQTPGGLSGLFRVSAQDAVSLQYVMQGTANTWVFSGQLNGEDPVTGQIDIHQVD